MLGTILRKFIFQGCGQNNLTHAQLNISITIWDTKAKVNQITVCIVHQNNMTIVNIKNSINVITKEWVNHLCCHQEIFLKNILKNCSIGHCLLNASIISDTVVFFEFISKSDNWPRNGAIMNTIAHISCKFQVTIQ